MHAAVEEDRKLAEQPKMVLYELEKKCVVVRWCDDLLQVWDRIVSKQTKQVLAELRAELAYGAPLRLVKLLKLCAGPELLINERVELRGLRDVFLLGHPQEFVEVLQESDEAVVAKDEAAPAVAVHSLTVEW